MTTTESSIADRIRACRDEQADIDDAELRDPYRGAEDVSAWHKRNERRGQRRVELEHLVRELQTWGSLFDSHREAINVFTGAVRPIARELAYVIEHRAYEIDRGRIVKALPFVHDWLQALQAFSMALDHSDENTRRVITRELAAWFTARDGVASAEANHWSGRVRLPHPELGEGGLPDFVRWGIHRVDGDQPA